MRYVLYILLFGIISFSSCVSGRRDYQSQGQIVRVVNVRALYQYMFHQDPQALALLEKHKYFKKKINEYPRGDKLSESRELKYYKGEMERHESRIREVKKKLLLKVKAAVKKYSQRNGVDVVLNSSDSVIYSRNTFDITGNIIQELKRNAEKNSLKWK